LTCPACRAELIGGQERCPACGTMVAPAIIGALAPDPSRPKPPVRDVASLRRAKEPAWKDEVRDRVQRRRRKREQGGGELPLFDAPPSEPSVEPESASHLEPEADAGTGLHPAEAVGPVLLGDEAHSDDPSAVHQRIELGNEVSVEADLPLRPEPARDELPEASSFDAREDREDDEPEDEWLPRDEPAALRPVERPAAFGDRFEAALVDAGLLLILDAVVIYFAGRAAQADLAAVLQHWPWLFSFLAFLGLSYAAWFTGTTGQTPGKMLVGLRVVETAGRPPSCQRAFLRAALGALGSALLGLGMLPLFFDPARRALHDRLLRTRVVKF
jgi:uncharacterized RDD family membrane protein YckC